MPHPPFNIFTHHVNPDGALIKLKELIPEYEVTTHPDGHWSEITGKWKRGWLKSPLKLRVTNDPDHYSNADWPTQLDGMTNYFRMFARSEERADLWGYLPGISYGLSFILDPAPVDEDPREEVIFEMSRFLSGVIFLPGYLLDNEGRVIVEADGDIDPDAQLPDHEPVNRSESAPLSEDAQAELACDPPDAMRVLGRLVLMIALIDRGFLDLESTDESDAYRINLIDDLKEADFWKEAEPWEVDALETPVGSLSDKLRWKLPWLSEGAAILAWSLQQLKLPAYDQQVNVNELYGLREKMASPDVHRGLRSIDEMKSLSFQMLAIHWRLRKFYIDSEPMNFVEYAPRAWCGPMDLGLARLSGNDLEVGGKALSDASEEAWKVASGIMEERRKAIHWLLGHHPIYSENDTST